ncbi:arginine--tRNA ligase [Jeotgalibacillus marinus]|uniref:Arginine--tRNA ligase n=1 Tax=Jeotgalibacillus marinus TaxID=86667 RepID=A0ABV3Q0U2_9BACL
MKRDIAQTLNELLSNKFSTIEIEKMIEKPKHVDHGDLAFPCFRFAREFKQSPADIARDLGGAFVCEGVHKVNVVGGYINFYLDIPILAAKVMSDITTQGSHFGEKQVGQGKAVTIDLSSPNIAKPFSMGHLRSTVIGNALANIVEKVGYKSIRINHIGDWGTQFGKLITAYKKWGDEEKVKTSPIVELHKLYVHFHEQAELDPSLNDEARLWFKRLEEGDAEAAKLWEWFREVSLHAFSLVYELMGISFDSFNGEAFYNDKMSAVIDMLERANLLEESDGAMVVRLDEEGLPPCLIKKRDGATLYATRDLAAAYYRYENYSFAKSLYVVGNEQSLHFKQLAAVLKKLDVPWANDLVHIPFGMMLKDGKKMSTRKGKVVLLEEVLAQSVKIAQAAIEEKNPTLAKKDLVAKKVGVGAVLFHDLKVFRQNDVHFSLEDMLRFEGETGPYVQYAHARACSILRKAKMDMQHGWSTTYETFGEEERPLIIQLHAFEDTISEAVKEWDPSKVAKYVVELCQHFNHYYAHVNFLQNANEQEKQQRLTLIYSTTIVIKESLRLLGIDAPEEM